MFFSHHFRMRSVLTMFCFCAALLFMGCQPEPDHNFTDDHKLNSALIGTWTDQFDGYTITADRLSYGYGEDYISYAGTIEYVSNFSDNAGVIIIKYEEAHKPEYYTEYDTEPPYSPIGDPLPLNGDYIGIYYRNLKPGVSVEMSGAINPDYSPAEAATMYEAAAKFTQANGYGYYVTLWGGPYLR